VNTHAIRISDAADGRLQAEARIANQLQSEQPGLTRTSALTAARKLLLKIDFLDGKLAALSLR
jgi:hypothetical protein